MRSTPPGILKMRHQALDITSYARLASLIQAVVAFRVSSRQDEDRPPTTPLATVVYL